MRVRSTLIVRRSTSQPFLASLQRAGRGPTLCQIIKTTSSGAQVHSTTCWRECYSLTRMLRHTIIWSEQCHVQVVSYCHIMGYGVVLLTDYGNSAYQSYQKRILTVNYSKIQLDLQRWPILHCHSLPSLPHPPHPHRLVCIPLYLLPDPLGSAAQPCLFSFPSERTSNLGERRADDHWLLTFSPSI